MAVDWRFTILTSSIHFHRPKTMPLWLLIFTVPIWQRPGARSSGSRIHFCQTRALNCFPTVTLRDRSTSSGDFFKRTSVNVISQPTHPILALQLRVDPRLALLEDTFLMPVLSRTQKLMVPLSDCHISEDQTAISQLQSTRTHTSISISTPLHGTSGRSPTRRQAMSFSENTTMLDHPHGLLLLPELLSQ